MTTDDGNGFALLLNVERCAVPSCSILGQVVIYIPSVSASSTCNATSIY